MLVLSNLAISLDGKIATAGRGFLPLGTRRDLEEMLKLRKRCDAVLIGASTLRPYKKPSLSGGKGRQPVNVVLSSSLTGLSPSWPFFKDARIRRILITTSRAPAARRKHFERSCEVVVLPRGAGARRILRELSRRGISKLAVEGGGTVMWLFARENLIDEYHVTLTPRILGGRESPTLVDGLGFAPARVLNLKLVSCRRKGDELFLVYRRTSRRGP
jgi:riboflavin-specific deaminase-like protein